MRLVLTILLLYSIVSCSENETDYSLPSIAKMEVGESLTFLDYGGHIPLSVGERSNLGGAYQFIKESDSTFKIFRLDPYTELPQSSILDSSLINSSFVTPIDSLINYYREFNTKVGGCSAVTNMEFIWQGSSQIIVEMYSDDSCNMPSNLKSRTIMPALWESGLKPKP